MAISESLKTPVRRTRSSTASASSGRTRVRNASAAEGGTDDILDQLVIGKAHLRAGSGDAGIGFEAGVRIDLEDEGPAAHIDAEIDARISGEAEQAPAGAADLIERRLQVRLALVPAIHP